MLPPPCRASSLLHVAFLLLVASGAAAATDCGDDRPLIGELCDMDLDPSDRCSGDALCGYFPDSDFEYRCQTPPPPGGRCLASGGGYANNGCPAGEFCQTGYVCVPFPAVGEPCQPARKGLGVCAPGNICVELGEGTVVCQEMS